MTDETCVRLDRADTVDTSDMRTIMLTLNTQEVRREGAVPDEIVRIFGRLVLGLAVPRAELERWKIGVLRMYEMSELKAEGPPTVNRGHFRPIDMTEHSNVGPLVPIGNVVPLRAGAEASLQGRCNNDI